LSLALDDHGILGDLGSLTDQPRSTSGALNAGLIDNTSSAVDVTTSDSLLDQTAAILSSMEESQVSYYLFSFCKSRPNLCFLLIGSNGISKFYLQKFQSSRFKMLYIFLLTILQKITYR